MNIRQLSYYLVLISILLPLLLLGQIDSIDVALRSRPETPKTVDWLQEVIEPLKRTDSELLETYAKKSLSLAREIGYRSGEGKGLELIGLSLKHRDQYDEAIAHYLQAIDIFRQVGDRVNEASAQINIANLYDELGQSDRAKVEMQQAISILERENAPMTLSRARLNLGVVYFYLEDYDSALYYFNEVMKYRKEVQDTSGIAILYLNTGNVYEMQGDLEAAKEGYMEALKWTKDHELLAANIYLGIGNILLMQGKEEGLEYLEKGMKVAEDTEQPYMRQVGISYYKKYYLRKGDYENAYRYLDEEYKLDDEIRGEQVQKEIEVLSLKYEDERKAKQLAELRASQAQQRLFLGLTGGASLALLAITGLILYVFRLRTRNSQLEMVTLRGELDQKNKELASYALNFIQKNELLHELTDKINDIKKSANDKTRHSLNQLNGVINGSMRIDQDWETFRRMFEEVHTGFFTRLKEEFPELSNADLKLSALLRLNMNLKESSRVLGISSDSVKTARYRLRKKFGLNTEDNLIDFLIAFDAKNTPTQAL